jgi:predicted Rossmann-fold nucleotide-binding protein
MGRRWRFAEEALPVLQRLSERRACKVSVLCEAARGRLTAEKVRAFVAELALHGLVAVEGGGGEGATGGGGA